MKEGCRELWLLLLQKLTGLARRRHDFCSLLALGDECDGLTMCLSENPREKKPAPRI